MKAKVLFMFLPALLLTACLDNGQKEAPLEFSYDKEEVFAVADVFNGDGELSKTIRIISNRSWSAHLNDLDNPIDESDPSQSVPWATISVEEHPNVTNVTDEVEVTINFNRNYSKDPVNGVLNIYCEGQLRKSIPVTQAGVVYFIDASYDGGTVSDNGGTVFLNVRSNAPWTARLDPSSTADAVLLTTEGMDSGEIRVRFRSNDDAVEKTAKVLVSSDGIEDAVVELTQSPMSPEVKIFSFGMSFIPTGSKLTQTPLLVIDQSTLDPAVIEAGVKFYYKMSTTGFSDEMVPDTSCPEFPEEGLAFVNSGTKKDEAYVQILAVCPGYRDVNLKVDCRHWRLGSVYINAVGTTDELFISLATSVKDTYLQYDSKKTEIGTYAKWDGDIRLTRLFYNNTSLTQMSFVIAGKNVSSYTYASKETTSSKPDMLVSPLVTVKAGDKAHVENTNKKKGQIITFACLEQFTYKP